jgi:hypothetical protein
MSSHELRRTAYFLELTLVVFAGYMFSLVGIQKLNRYSLPEECLLVQRSAVRNRLQHSQDKVCQQLPKVLLHIKLA